MRRTDARSLLLAAAAACLLACTGPGLEPPDENGEFAAPGGGSAGRSGGGRDAGTPENPPPEPDPNDDAPGALMDAGTMTDAADAADAGDGGDPDLDAGAP